MDYTKMSNNVAADAYYDNGYGYLRSSTAKTLSRANPPSAGYAHAMCWRKPLVKKLKKLINTNKNDNILVAEKELLAKKNTEKLSKKFRFTIKRIRKTIITNGTTKRKYKKRNTKYNTSY